MKKFLTVLLVIAVMFTFSFSSAFAYTTNEFNANVNTAEAQVLASLATTYNNVVANLTKANTAAGVAADVAAWTAASKEAYNDAVATVKAKTNEIKADATNQDKEVYQLVALYTLPTAADLRDAVYAENDAAAVAQFPVTKAAELAKLDTVDTSVYSVDTKEITYKNYAGKTVTEETSYRAIAEAYIADAKAAIDAIVLADGDDDAAVAAKIKKVTGVSGKFVEIKDEDKKGTGVYEIKANTASTIGLKTLAEEQAAAVSLDAKKAVKLSQIATASANLYAQAVDAKLSADAMAEFNANRAAYVEMANYLVEIAKTEADLQFAEPVSYTDIANHAKLKAAYDELEVYAAKYAAETKDGVLVRDADAIAEILKAAKLDIYKNCTTANVEAYKKQIREAVVTAAVDPYDVQVAKAALEAKKEAALKNYYEPEQAKVAAAYDALIAKVEASKTAAELAKVAKDADLKGIDTKNTVKGKIQATVTTEEAKLQQYLGYLNATADTKGQRAQADFDAINWVEWYAEQGARTAAEVKALYSTAVAKVEAIPTEAQIAETKKAVEDQIAALPAKITSADKDAVLAAVKAVEEYGKNDVANQSTLELAKKALVEALRADIDAAVKALPEGTKATAADKVAIKAVQEMIDAYNEVREDLGGSKYNAPAKVTTGLATIKAAEKKAIEDAVAALPLNITLADKAAVEAVRAAYDAYVAEYTDYAKNIDAREDLKSIASELKAAEKAIEEAVLANAKAVTSLKIKASSKATKGAMTISWRVIDGDKSVAAGYQVWRSTKANKGFKKMITTSKMTYKNTKNLKKGTTYYYRVRAYARAADGKLYFSDFSNKAYRKAK